MQIELIRRGDQSCLCAFCKTLYMIEIKKRKYENERTIYLYIQFY